MMIFYCKNFFILVRFLQKSVFLHYVKIGKCCFYQYSRAIIFGIIFRYVNLFCLNLFSQYFYQTYIDFVLCIFKKMTSIFLSKAKFIKNRYKKCSSNSFFTFLLIATFVLLLLVFLNYSYR